MAVIGVPATAGLLLLAGPILATLFGYGEFGTSDTRMAALALLGYGVGLPAFLLVKIFQPGFFSRQNTRTPVRIGVIALVANMGLNVVIVGGLVLGQFVGAMPGLTATMALAVLVPITYYMPIELALVMLGWPAASPRTPAWPWRRRFPAGSTPACSTASSCATASIGRSLAGARCCCG